MKLMRDKVRWQRLFCLPLGDCRTPPAFIFQRLHTAGAFARIRWEVERLKVQDSDADLIVTM